MIKWIKPGLIFCLILLLITSLVFADEPMLSGSKLDKTLTKKHSKYLDVNQIRCVVINDGTFSNHPITGASDMEWPKGSGKYICFLAGVWIAGKVDGQIRTACADYRQEYQPGVILPDGTADDPSKEEYRVFKVHKDYPDGQTDLEIDSWIDWQTHPENHGAPPVSDENGNWIGFGDEMVYCVQNDLDENQHNTSYHTLPIGIELHTLYFGFDRAGALGNSMFILYTIINKGEHDLDSTYIATWSDVDNGGANDDLVGYDLDLGMGYCYGGKPIDSSYGDKPPALGWDFFQGPIIDSPGDSVRLPDGTVLYDKKKLDATAFTKYINSSTQFRDPPTSAEGAEWVYNYMSGYQKDGTPFIDPITGQPSKVINTGDPVTGTGWLSTAEWPPADIRMLTSAGPFTLAVGDTQKIVLGCVIAQGKNRLSSVAKLRFEDKQVQQAYDLNFQVPSPPLAPEVVVTEQDREILLSWGKRSEDYGQAGYNFEGYNVYIGNSEGGPWNRLATFDLQNSVLVVKDETYDDESGITVAKPSAYGEDTGLRYNYVLTKDFNDLTFANGRNYYMVVTAYGYGAGGVPQILESSKNVLTVTPHKPRPGTIVNQEFGEEIVVNHSAGTASKDKYEVWVVVADPLNVETAAYEIVVNPDSSWTLWKNGQAVPEFTDLKEYGINKDMTQSSYIGSGIDFFLGFEADFDNPPASTFITKLITDEGPENPELLTSLTGPMGLGLGPVTDLAADGQYKKGTRDPSVVYNTLEIRFTGVLSEDSLEVVSGGSLATLLFGWGDPANFLPQHPKNPNPGSRDPFLVRVPFEVWDMERNIQLNLAFTDYKQKISDSLFVPTWHPRGQCAVYIIGTEYDEQIHNVSFTGTDTMATWNFIYTPDATWSTGDIVELSFKHPPVTGKEMTVEIGGQPVTLQPDRFTFTIQGVTENDVDDAKKRLDIINVFPNPYLGYNIMEKKLHEEHISFINLPEDYTIRIFTLAGQLVKTITPLDPGNTTRSWDLRNENGLPVASGFYFAHIDIPGVGEKILKLAVVFRQQRLKNL